MRHYTEQEVIDLMNEDVIKLLKHFKCFSKTVRNIVHSLNSAIKQPKDFRRDSPERIIQKVKSNDWRDVLLGGFLWSDSIEGNIYWNKKYTAIDKYIITNNIKYETYV